MNFKKGDLVECWDSICDLVRRGEYFAFNDHPETSSPHLVRTFYPDGTAHADLITYQHCRPARPDLEMDDPVWVEIGGEWESRHFAEWSDKGRMMYWGDGKTSHTVSDKENDKLSTHRYRLTPPDSDGSSE